MESHKVLNYFGTSTFPFIKGAYYSEIKIFNNLPLEIKNVAGNQIKIKML
jgi:hypothetical protein